MIGKQIRQYRIEDRLGEGGMGVVYRATDTRLHRPVAIKVLPPELVASADRKKRFIQEARAASALNHPNIVTIYDIDTVDVEGASVDFMAMEYVAGQTLDKLLAAPGGLKLRDALKLAVQLAGALAAAHAGGIVHRDLKPSNVIVTPEGNAKLLDFGLAKLSERAEGPALDVAGETELLAPSLVMTQEGLIVGTVFYMSPEQAESKRVDARSDIFSLGALLYEMFTVQKPFPGTSKIAVLSAILHKDPLPMNTYTSAVRPELERAVLRCLRKDPAERWQHASDLRIALEDLRDESSNPPPPPPAPLRAAPDGGISRRAAVSLAAGGLVAGTLAGGYAGRALLSPEPVTYSRLTYNRGDVFCARFAPDGSIVYSANWEGSPYTVYSLRPGVRESRSLGLGADTNLAGVSSSSDLALLLAGGMLARVPMAGGAPRELVEGVLEADWSPDAKELAIVRRVEDGFQLEYPAGKLLHRTRGAPPMRPRIAPDGASVVFVERDPGVGDLSIRVARHGAEVRTLAGGMRGIAGITWAAGGREVWFSAIRRSSDNPAVMAVTLAGELRLVTQSPTWLSIHDMSPLGELLVASTSSRVGIRGLLPGETATRDLSWHENSVVSQLNGDGSLLLMELGAGDGRNNAIYYARPGKSAVRLGDGNSPALSPDGKLVACVRRSDSAAVLETIPTGAGETKVLPTPGLTALLSLEWFPDGSRLLLVASSQKGIPRAYAVPLTGGQPPVPVTPPGVRAGRVSPDGSKLIALAPKAAPELQNLNDPGARQPIPGIRTTDTVLAWTQAGDGLILRAPAREQVRIERLHLATGARTVLHEIALPEPGDSFRREFVVAGDGRAYAYSFQRDLASLFLVRGLR